MEDSEIIYQELKLKLKMFELNFMKENKRKPSKEDIALDTEISKVYGTYWKIHQKRSLPKSNNTKITNEKSKEIDIWKINTKSSVKKGDTIRKKAKDTVVLKGFASKLWNNRSDSILNSPKERSLTQNKASDECESPKLTSPVALNVSLREEINQIKNIDNGCVKDDEFSANIFKNKHNFIKNTRFTSSTKKVDLYQNNKPIERTYDLSWLEKCEKLNDSFEKHNEPFETEETLNNESGECETNKPDLSIGNSESHTSPKNNIEEPTKITSELNCDQIPVEIPVDISSSESQSTLLVSKTNAFDENITAKPVSTCLKTTKSSNKRPPEPEESSVFDFIGDSSVKQPSKKRKLDSEKSVKTSNAPKAKLGSSVGSTSSLASSKPQKGNFIRLNLKKKCFAKGQGRRNLPHKYKMMKYKKRQGSGAGKCFKCGQPGHWANKCNFEADGDQIPKVEADKTEVENVDNPETDQNEENKITNQETTGTFKFSSLPEIKPSIIKPIYDNDSFLNNSWATEEVLGGLKKMGHKQFRDFQEKAVMRILCGQSTLLVLPTGSGKSLCYQLPAYLYGLKEKCITLVISPLVSLMEDQVKGLPKFLLSVFLHSGMTANQRQKSIELVKEGNVRILLLSPEFMLSSHGYLMSFLPPISFVCIDEAHCLSEWSHNFRPSYLQLVKVIKEQMGVSCILALTATATKRTILQIKEQIGLSEGDSVIGQTAIPENLYLSASCDINKDEALLRLLDEERFQDGSIIVYCTRREETERVATRLRIKFLDDSQKPSKNVPNKTTKTKNKTKKECHEVSPYHAGLSPSQRRSIQKLFMTDKMKVVVATVAFGMGLNKADVRGIIHFNMPKSFESYVQEVGRAGRDGLPAHCHLFLDPEGRDFVELRRHIYGNSLDRHAARKLLTRVFKSCNCTQNCPGHNVALPIQPIVEELDLKEENITTLLCYLELHPKKWVEVYAPTMSTCKLQCYQGAKQLESVCKTCEPVAVGRKLGFEKSKEKPNCVKFNYVQVASEKNWNPILVRRALKQLEFAKTNGNVHRSGVMVEFSDLSFHIRRRGDYTDEEKDEMLNCLYDKVVRLENRQLNQLSHVFHTFSKYSETEVTKCLDGKPQNSDGIKTELMKYFNAENMEEYKMETGEITSHPNNINGLRQSIKMLLNIHHEHSFTGRQVAQIFYGIGSPKFPAEVWGRARQFWRSHMEWEFNKIISIANEEIVALK